MGLMCVSVEFCWTDRKRQHINIGDTPFQAGVEGAVWVEYAHPT